MFLFKRNGQKILNTGQSFRSFWQDGFEGHRPNLDDWKTHLNTLFPEVRLKRTIEVRAADAQAADMRTALPALWTGIFYDDRALAEAEELVEGWTYDEMVELRPSICREGVRASFRGAPVASVAARVVAIADGGLARRARVGGLAGKDERVYLEKLRTLVGQGRSPADALLEGLDREKDPARAMLERAALKWE
jgi:glutamate--cysteine ligase